MAETPNLRWFEKTDRQCVCGKRATGILRGVSNESYGPHCTACATKRLNASAIVRADLEKQNAARKDPTP